MAGGCGGLSLALGLASICAHICYPSVHVLPCLPLPSPSLIRCAFLCVARWSADVLPGGRRCDLIVGHQARGRRRPSDHVCWVDRSAAAAAHHPPTPTAVTRASHTNTSSCCSSMISIVSISCDPSGLCSPRRDVHQRPAVPRPPRLGPPPTLGYSTAGRSGFARPASATRLLTSTSLNYTLSVR